MFTSTNLCLYWSVKPAERPIKSKNIDMAYKISGKTLVIIGKNIRKIRESQKREQVEVAEEAGIDPSYYARVERAEANPTLEIFYAIVKALHIESSEILPF